MEKEIQLYQSEQKIYPRDVFGIYAKFRWLFVWITQIIFYGTPWVSWGGRQAILFDIEHRRFYLFDIVFYPQDLIYLTLLLIICAISLFLFTAIAGRLWCGYACPQTVYTEIFLWIESKIEGNFFNRKKLDLAGWNIKKISLKVLKHSVWLFFSIWTGITFVGYFIDINLLVNDLQHFLLSGWVLFWVIFYSMFTYMNAGFMREQVCKYMCPYARFQSAMFDQHTLIVTYDHYRGEPRKISQSKIHGDCINCQACIQVCPTGIDIRDGLQYECIGCGLCVDACNTIMEKTGKFKNLIRYSTDYKLKNKIKNGLNYQEILRPRILIYTFILLSLIALFFYFLESRYDYKYDVVKDRKVMYRLDENNNIENVYRIKVMNASNHFQKYHLGVDGLFNIKIDERSYGRLRIELDPSESDWFVVTVELPNGVLQSGNYPIHFLLKKENSDDIVFEKATFLVPNNEN